MVSVTVLDGVSRHEAERLANVGVRTTDQLLELGSTSTDRMRLADETNLNDADIKAWVHQADLLRINGMTAAFSSKLCQAGVCTVPKLAYRSAEKLSADLTARAAKPMVDKMKLQVMIAEAKALPKLVHH